MTWIGLGMGFLCPGAAAHHLSARQTSAGARGTCTTPCRRANTTACSCECTPSFARMFPTWLRWVRGEMWSLRAIAALSRPVARSWRISRRAG